jgi:hypothetical protein
VKVSCLVDRSRIWIRLKGGLRRASGVNGKP